MSEESKIDDSALHEEISEKAKLQDKKDEVLKKELIVKERRLDNELEKMAERDKSTEIAKKTDYGVMTAEEVAAKQKDNAEYMVAARNKMMFIHSAFGESVPFFRKNLILVAGKTGEGKSTTVANIIKSTLGIDKRTGKKRRVLVLTNEEKSEDVYNRVTCLLKGWHYVNHDKFTDQDIVIFNQYIASLSKDGMLTVIDDNYNKAGGTTTTVEGICQVIDNLIEKQEFFDVIIIDYFQNIGQSRQFPFMKNWEVQELLAAKLDHYKNVYPAPIVLLAQVTPPEGDKTPFQFRIQGRKSILNVATCCVEMVANREDLTTEWHIHKSRFNQATGKVITTGYNNGEYVTWDEEFRAKIQKMKDAKQQKEVDRASNGKMPEVTEETKEEPNDK